MNALEILVGYCLRQLAIEDGRARVLEGVEMHAYHMARFTERSKEEAIEASAEARDLALSLMGKLEARR